MNALEILQHSLSVLGDCEAESLSFTVSGVRTGVQSCIPAKDLLDICCLVKGDNAKLSVPSDVDA